jgi:hypothetical protein
VTRRLAEVRVRPLFLRQGFREKLITEHASMIVVGRTLVCFLLRLFLLLCMPSCRGAADRRRFQGIVGEYAPEP